MQIGTQHRIVSSFGTAHLNDLLYGSSLVPSGSGLLLQSIAGAEQAPLRATVDNRTRTDGANLHRTFKGPKVITLDVLVVATEPAYRTALTDNLLGVLEAMLDEEGAYYFGDYSHSVKYYDPVEVQHPGSSGVGVSAGPKLLTFSLIAGNPELGGASLNPDFSLPPGWFSVDLRGD